MIRVEVVAVLKVRAFKQAYISKGSDDFVGSRLPTRRLSFQLSNGPTFPPFRGKQLQ